MAGDEGMTGMGLFGSRPRASPLICVAENTGKAATHPMASR